MSDSILEFMAKDHDRLDALFVAFQQAQTEDAARSREIFRAFDHGLRRHIVWEEELLFPVFEERMGSSSGPTEVMRQEHEQIKNYLTRIASGEEEDDGQTAEWLGLVLSGHNQKEENILYPWIEQLSSAEQRMSLLNRMSAEAPEISISLT